MTLGIPSEPPRALVPGPRRRSLWARLWLTTWRGRLAWAGGTVLAAVLALWLLARATPSWYEPLDRTDQNVIDLAARANVLLTYELRNTAQRVPLGEQRWTITQDEINSYLAVNMAPVFEGEAGSGGGGGGGKRAAAPIYRPCVTFAPGRVMVSARLDRVPGSAPQGGVGTLVFSVGTTPGPDGKPMGLVKLTGVWIGYLPVPASLVQGRLKALIPVVSRAIEEAIPYAMGARDPAQWVSISEKVVRCVGEGQPFPLQYHIDRRDLIVRELQVEDNGFTLAVSPVAPGGVAGAGAGGGAAQSAGGPAMPGVPRAQ